MVYCGKPSKGCKTCRERKIRCDQLLEGCTQCAKTQRKCPGYRDQMDLMFRNESQDVVRKAKAKEAKLKQASATKASAPTPNAATTTTLVTSRARPHPSGQSVESVLIGGLEVDRHRDPLSLPFALVPTLEERATGFFFTNFVIGVHGPTKGHLDHLTSVLHTDHLDDTLVASMKSVGLAGYAHVANAPQLTKDARQEYMKALRLTNAALQSPTDVKKDSTLLAVMILSIFETITGCNQKSMSAWAEHINGAGALVKLRGVEQLKTPGGRRLFIQVTSNLLICCIQRRLQLPRHIVELRAEAAKFISDVEIGWQVQEAMVNFTELRYNVRVGLISLPQDILAGALEIDNFLLETFTKVPHGWDYQTVFTDDDPDLVYNGCYHVYYDHWVAQLWNAMRSIRIMSNEMIRDSILAGWAAKPPLFVGPEYVTQLEVSIATIYTMQADILASVPQHLGYVSKHVSTTTTTTSSSSASPTASHNGTSTFLWTDFASTTPNDSKEPSTSTNFLPTTPPSPPSNPLTKNPLIRASGGYFLLWPLYLVGVMDISTPTVQAWAARNLRVIGHTMGIAQALVIAELVERQEEIKVWRQSQNRSSAASTPDYSEAQKL